MPPVLHPYCCWLNNLSSPFKQNKSRLMPRGFDPVQAKGLASTIWQHSTGGITRRLLPVGVASICTENACKCS